MFLARPTILYGTLGFKSQILAVPSKAVDTTQLLSWLKKAETTESVCPTNGSPN